MVARIARSLAVSVALGWLAWGAASRADDVGATGVALVVSADPDGGQVLVTSLQNADDLHFGPGGSPDQFRADFQIYEVDAPTQAGVLHMPSPWTSANATVLKFKRPPESSDSPVGVAVVKAGKLVRLRARSLGGYDLRGLPGPGGVVTVFTIRNDADGSVHSICTRYSEADGSTLGYKSKPNRISLIAKGGVAVSCPACLVNEVLDGSETDIDCGGDCPSCEADHTCFVNEDCLSDLCVDDVCLDGLPSLSACIVTPSLPGCSVVLPSLSACIVTPSLPGCSVVLPSLSACIATPSLPGCSVVLPSLSACIATPSLPGCSVVLPSLSACIVTPSLPGCSVVLPSLSACIATPSLPGCSVVLPSLSACIATPSLPGCSVVLPSLSACIATPSLPGCSVVLPSLSACIVTPSLPGCSVVLPSLDACIATPSLPGCSVVLP